MRPRVTNKMSVSKMWSIIVAGHWDICKFGESSKNCDDSIDCTSKSSGRPSHGGRRLAVDLVDCRQVGGCIEVVHGDVDDPNMIEVDNKMTDGMLVRH